MIIHDTVLEEIKNYKINEINDILLIKSKNYVNQNVLYTRRFEHLY